MFIRLWFQSLDRAIHCVLEPTLHIAPLHSAAKRCLALRWMDSAKFFHPRYVAWLQHPYNLQEVKGFVSICLKCSRHLGIVNHISRISKSIEFFLTERSHPCTPQLKMTTVVCSLNRPILVILTFCCLLICLVPCSILSLIQWYVFVKPVHIHYSFNVQTCHIWPKYFTCFVFKLTRSDISQLTFNAISRANNHIVKISKLWR